jgi:hypothetical protein
MSKKERVKKAKFDLLRAGGKVSDLLAEVAPDLVQKLADKANKKAKKT